MYEHTIFQHRCLTAISGPLVDCNSLEYERVDILTLQFTTQSTSLLLETSVCSQVLDITTQLVVDQ